MVNCVAGDISEVYGAHCAAGINGQVQIIYSGPVVYMGVAAGAITPTSISGDTLTWSIADFGTIVDDSAFQLLFQVDSNAVPGTSLCMHIIVTPTSSDYNPGNNDVSWCFQVVNALDPNEKEVYPSGAVDTGGWLTYTIRFQNSGTAPAVNIYIMDTLDASLDPSTFQLLAYSAKNFVQLFGNVVRFNFANINLPDSATSDSASRGYVQYKVKLKQGVPIGSQINNTAYIYFDLNPAVVTNTTNNTVELVNGITNLNVAVFNLYPNPAHTYCTIEGADGLVGSNLQLIDLTGREVSSFKVPSPRYSFSTASLPAGIYLVKLTHLAGGTTVRKLVIE